MEDGSKKVGRRQLMAWLAAAAAASTLAACGGGGKSITDPVDELATLQTQQRLNEQVAVSLKNGLVGTVIGQLNGPDGKLVRAASGSTKLSGGKALNGDERFIIGSNTKAMTAALAAICVERGLLRWDSKPADVIPELRGNVHAGYKDVTLVLLLDHLGGLMAFTGEEDALKFAAFLEGVPGALPGTPAGRRRFMASWLLAQAPAAKAGQEFLYSNAGYTLAAAMLEAVTGQDFEALFESMLAKPLKLDVQWRHPVGDTQPQGHVGDTVPLLQAWQPLPADWQVWLDAMGPSGSANMSVAGYSEWQRLHLQAFQGRSTPLPAAYLTRIRGLKLGQYALGWMGGEVNGQALLFHTGADEGFMAIAGMRLDGKRSFVAMTNTFGYRTDGSSWVMDSLGQTAEALVK